MKIDYPPPPTQLLLPRPRSSLPPETNLSNPKEDSRNLLNPKEDLTSCPALDRFCFLQEEQQHVHQTTFSHDPLKIFAHSSTTHNRLLHILHILSQPIKIFAHSSTSHNRFLRFLHILPQPTKKIAISSTTHKVFGTFFHNPQQILALSSHSSTTHKDFCTFFLQPTTDFCKFFLKIQKTFVAFCVYYSNTQIPFNSIQTKTTKLRIGLPILRAISNKTSNWVAKSVHNLEQNFELDCQICVQSSNKTSN
jgi:hypothetical protein